MLYKSQLNLIQFEAKDVRHVDMKRMPKLHHFLKFLKSSFLKPKETQDGSNESGYLSLVLFESLHWFKLQLMTEILQFYSTDTSPIVHKMLHFSGIWKQKSCN